MTRLRAARLRLVTRGIPESPDEVKGDEEGTVAEDNEEEKKPKTKKVEKTTWDWELCNSAKPIWTRKPDDIE